MARLQNRSRDILIPTGGQDYPMSLSASDYGDFTRIMALYKLHYLLTFTTFLATKFSFA